MIAALREQQAVMIPLDEVICGDCLAVLKTLPDNSIDAIVTDPPAGIAFMGKAWDNPITFPMRKRPADHDLAFGPSMVTGPEWSYSKKARDTFIVFLSAVMTEALRVLKPGGHALVWALPRTSHWTATAIEDAGFEIRDKCFHLFGSGFPKSTDISKQIDKMAPRQGMFTDFAKHFHAQRLASGLSQKQIAHHFPSKTGGMTGCVWNWENGVNVPTMEQWPILQPMLNLSGEWTPLIERIEAEREVIGKDKNWGKAGTVPVSAYGEWNITAPATPEAAQWEGYGTALKPAVEEWILARKPLAESSIAANVLTWGTGGINVDGCRVGLNGIEHHKTAGSGAIGTSNGIYGKATEALSSKQVARAEQGLNPRYDPQGRFPSHLLLSHSIWCTDAGCEADCPIAALDRMSGIRKSGAHKPYQNKSWNSPAHMFSSKARDYIDEGSEGAASRYFQHFHPDFPFIYTPKAGRAERNAGCDGLPVKEQRSYNHNYSNWTADTRSPNGGYEKNVSPPLQNSHPTVKSLSLMRWLVRLITPPGGTVLDCFAGSGSTLVACVQEGFHFIGIEQDASYCEIARARLVHAMEVVSA